MINRIVDLRNLDRNIRTSTSDGVILKSYDNGIFYKLPEIYEFSTDNIMNITEYLSTCVGKQLNTNVVETNIVKAIINYKNKETTLHLLASKEYIKTNSTYLPIEKINNIHELDKISRMKFLYQNINNTDDLDKMIIFDFIIRNLDRHGRNIEIETETFKLMPLFDHGLSMYSKLETRFLIHENEQTTLKDIRVNNYLGYESLNRNLNFVRTFQILPNYISLEEHFRELPNELQEEFTHERIRVLENILNWRLNYVRVLQNGFNLDRTNNFKVKW